MTAKDGPNIVPIGTPNLRDVPNMLRRLADMMESGEVDKAVHAIVVTDDDVGKVDVYGYGNVGALTNEIGLLQMAVIKLSINGQP